MALLIVNGMLCAIAILFAMASPREERSQAVFAGAVLFAVWALYVMPWVYEPLSPAGIAYRLGVTSVRHEHAWAFVDMLACIAIAIRCGSTWWGAAIWALYVSALMCHVLRWQGLDFGTYSHALDVPFYLQIALLFMLGGRGVRNRLSRGWTIRRVAIHSRVAAHLERP